MNEEGTGLKKRFWVFSYWDYNSGGLADIDSTFDTFDEANNYGKAVERNENNHGVEIFDADGRKMLDMVYTPEELKNEEELVQCCHIFQKGTDKGKQCDQTVPRGRKTRTYHYCQNHYICNHRSYENW